jgi:GTP cyclohydrolase IA
MYLLSFCRVLGGALFHEQEVRSAGGGLVVVRDVEFASTSEHDLLPFYGKCHIGYIPGQGIVLGLSKIARLAKILGSRIQTQQDLTNDILRAFHDEVLPQARATNA